MSQSRERLEEIYCELAWRRCQRDEPYALENFFHIKTPGQGKQFFKLREAQKIALGQWAEHRYSLTLKARQIGWSTVVAAHSLYLAFFEPDREILLISRGEREAKDLLAKSKYAFKFLPEWMLARGPKLVSEHQEKMVFDNGSSITSLPSAQDPARGSSAYLIVVDEWAFLPNAEEAWSSIEPVADVGGRIIGLSTANGSGNFFHELWVGATTGNNDFKPMFFPWYANEDRDQAWFESKLRAMNDWQRAQEYPNDPEEAFIKSGRPYFASDGIERQTRFLRKPQVGHIVGIAA